MTAVVHTQDAFANAFALTMTLASLASSTAEPPVGRESAEVDWTSYLGLAATLSGRITTGTSPTDLKQIAIWAWGGSYNGTTYRRPAGVTGADAGLTPVRNYWSSFRLVHVIDTTNTSNQSYDFANIPLPWKVIPIRFGLFIHHNTGVALNATGGNHVLELTVFKAQSN